ncbi:hypothetical protein LR013_01760 [candidate division NPL-UPA2 bacterium]|nr:hypothetical protein [candidate division NPL-UPA2 bacterium]
MVLEDPLIGGQVLEQQILKLGLRVLIAGVWQPTCGESQQPVRFIRIFL